MSGDPYKRLHYPGLFEDWELDIADRVAESFCGDWKPLPVDDHEDLVHELLIHWNSKKESYKGLREASLPTFMRKVLGSKALDLIRARKRLKRRTLDKAEPIEMPSGEEERREVADTRTPNQIELEIDLRLLLARLTPRQRRIHDLLFTHSKQQIAEELGLHRDTIHDEVMRIRKLYEKNDMKDYLK